MKLARNPSRSSPAPRATSPVATASVAVRVMNSDWPWVATLATAAADSAAVADIGPTIRWRELPSSA